MPRTKGQSLESTMKLKNNIVSFCDENRSYNDIATEFQVSYQTAWKYVRELISEGRLSLNGRVGGADVVKATNQYNIPHIPSAVGSVNPMRIVLRVKESKGKYKSKLEQLDEKWGFIITGIFRTAVVIKRENVFPADRHKEYEQYLRVYREELALRLAQVNALLQTDKFWTEEGLRDFQNDPAFDAAGILEAWQYLLSTTSGLEKKVE